MKTFVQRGDILLAVQEAMKTPDKQHHVRVGPQVALAIEAVLKTGDKKEMVSIDPDNAPKRVRTDRSDKGTTRTAAKDKSSVPEQPNGAVVVSEGSAEAPGV